MNGKRSGLHPNSLANLKSIKPGEVRNKTGRPKKLPDLDKILYKILSEKKNGITAAEALIKKLFQSAMTSNNSNTLRAIEILLERGYGKPKQQHQFVDENNNDVGVTVIIQHQDGNEAIAD